MKTQTIVIIALTLTFIAAAPAPALAGSMDNPVCYEAVAQLAQVLATTTSLTVTDEVGAAVAQAYAECGAAPGAGIPTSTQFACPPGINTYVPGAPIALAISALGVSRAFPGDSGTAHVETQSPGGASTASLYNVGVNQGLYATNSNLGLIYIRNYPTLTANSANVAVACQTSPTLGTWACSATAFASYDGAFKVTASSSYYLC